MDANMPTSLGNQALADEPHVAHERVAPSGDDEFFAAHRLAGRPARRKPGNFLSWRRCDARVFSRASVDAPSIVIWSARERSVS